MSQTEVQLIKSSSVVDADIVGMSSSKLTGTLPAVSAANLTNLPAANLTGALPAISGASLTNLPAGGKFASYAIIGDQKGNDYNGGTFTSGAWRTRDLNTEFADADGIVSISSNQFTLQAGTYFVRGHAPAYKTNRHVSKIQNVTDSSLVAMGTAEYNASDEGVQGRSSFSCRFTISGAKTFEIQHRADSTENTYGFGIAHNFGSGFNSIYTIVEIFKES